MDPPLAIPDAPLPGTGELCFSCRAVLASGEDSMSRPTGWLLLLVGTSCAGPRNEVRVDDSVKWYRLSPTQSIAVWQDQQNHVTCYVAEYALAGIALQCLPDFQPPRLPPTLPVHLAPVDGSTDGGNRP